VNVSPATIAVPIRERPALGSTLNVTDVGPRPDAGVTVSQLTFVAAVHGQAGAVVIAIAPAAPAAPTDCEAGEIAKVHPSDCVTLNVCPAIVMVALRGGAVDAGTSNDTVPFPCPLVVRS
jgi:hypothetical protein